MFLDWCNLQLTAYRSPPTNVYNNPSLINVNAVNNYNSAHFRQLTLMALRYCTLHLVLDVHWSC